MGKKKPKQRVTEYYTSIQYGVCHGVVERLAALRVNDKVIGDCSGIKGPVVYIDQPDLFGGLKKEGGLRGRMAWQNGSDDQLLDSYVASKKGRLPTDLPGYRGIATAYFTEWPTPSTAEAALEASKLGSVLKATGTSLGLLGGLLINFINAISPPPKKGFYWSANQPIIPPVHFRVTRLDRSWLPEIAAIPGDPDQKKQALCIAIDTSGSMTGGRLDAAKSATIQLLQDLKKSSGAKTFDIRVVGWNRFTTAIQRRNCTQAAYDEIIAFVQGLNYDGNTFFERAVDGLESFYDGAKGKCRKFLFLTDGLPSGGSNAVLASEILAETGAEAYAFNLVLTDTTYTSLMDNTSSDGVPVITLANAESSLSTLFRSATTSQIDMNPAHMIRECLINTVWGLGLPESALDVDMFATAAETLFNERFGLSMMWSRQSKVDEFISEILSHIQGTVYVNPMTGKICLKLIRNDYDASTLDILTPSNSRVTSFKRRSPAEITNEINVTWTNPNSEKEEVISRQSLGSIVANNGEVVSDNRNYYGVRRAGLAAELCARDLAAATAPLSSAEVNANREFSRKVPGDVVKLTDPENGANQIIMRIMKIDYGYVGSSEVKLTLTEDVFSYAQPRYVEPTPGDSDEMSESPEPPSLAEVFTLNTYMNQSLSDGLDDLADPETQVAFLVGTTQQDAFNVEVQQETLTVTGDTEYQVLGEFDFVGLATLAEELPPAPESEVALPVPVNGAAPTPGAFAIIGPIGLPEDLHEIVLVSSFDRTTGLSTIRRGMMDTVPRHWATGTTLRYLDQLTRFVNPNSTVAGLSEEYRFHTRTSLGLLPDDIAPSVTYVATQRLYAPARPANVVVAGEAFGFLDGSLLTDVSVTWSDRNRLTEDAVLLGWDEPTVTPEAGQTTTVRLIDYDTGITLTEYTGLTGTSLTFPASDRSYANAVSVTVLSARDGIESIQAHSVLVQFPDFLRRVEDSDDERGTETGDYRRTED